MKSLFARPNDPSSQSLSAVDAASTSIEELPLEAVDFEAIVARYHGKIFQLVFRYTGDYEDSCDLTQDTFVRAYRAWNEFRGDAQIYTWLYRIAINLCHNHQKKTQRKRDVERISLDAPMFFDEGCDGYEGLAVADEGPLPLQILESDELRRHLQRVLGELPENYRTVIVLRDIEGLSYDEIARVTDSTLEAIKSRLFRARASVRRLMEPYIKEGLASATPAAESVPSEAATRARKTALSSARR